MDIRDWTFQANLSENIAALERTDAELLVDDPTYEPMGEETKARLLAELRGEQERLNR